MDIKIEFSIFYCRIQSSQACKIVEAVPLPILSFKVQLISLRELFERRVVDTAGYGPKCGKLKVDTCCQMLLP